MNGNPYSKIIGLMKTSAREAQSTAFRYGTVLSVNPCRIEVGGTVQDGDSLIKNADVVFAQGDNVILASLDNDQLFCILCKVGAVDG